MLALSKSHRFSKIILGVIFISFLSIVFSIQSVSAYTKIKNSQIVLVSDFTLKNKANAGGTITKDYYVFPDTKGLHGGPGKITVVDRKTCQVTDTVSIGSMYLSGLYNKWGTNYITLIGMGKQKGCYRLKGSKLVKDSGCPTPPGRSLSYQGTGQGNVATFNGYTFKVAGFRGGIIGVWNSSGARVATYQIPSSVVSAEPENISIDGATGEVYVNYADRKNGKLHSQWYKINSSVFSKYTGKKGTSTPMKCKNNTATGKTASQSGNRHSSIVDDEDEPTVRPNTTPTRPDAIVSTIFFGDIKDDGKGCGIYTVLDLVMTIMTIGIGVLAVISISLAGITYATAGGNVAKTTKAKRRIYETIIGLVAYAAIFAILTFLLPEFNPELKTCGQIDTSETTDETETDTQPVDTSVPAEDDTVDIDLTNDAPTNEE